MFDLRRLAELDTRPAPFDPLDGPIWNEPYLQSHILYAHLDSRDDDASRPLPQIQRECAWINRWARENLTIQTPPRALDLGCGPGLYAHELARLGWSVWGVDLSATAIAYANEQAQDEGLQAQFLTEDLHTWSFLPGFDLILMTYGTLGTFSPAQAQRWLTQCYQALNPGGVLLVDTFDHRWWQNERRKSQPTWKVHQGPGFWSPEDHLVLSRQYVYPRLRTFSRVWTVVESSRLRRFAFWYRWHEISHLRELFCDGWQVQWFGGLEGQPCGSTGWIAAAARKE